MSTLAFSLDGTLLASGGWDQTVRLWDVATGQERQTLIGHAMSVWDVTFLPDGSQLASSSADGTILLWPAEPTDQLLVVLAPEPGALLHRTQPIAWRTTAVRDDTITIEVRSVWSPPSPWQEIAANEPDDGEYLWDTTAVRDGPYQLRITSTSGEATAIGMSGKVTVQNHGPPYVHPVARVRDTYSGDVEIVYRIVAPNGDAPRVEGEYKEAGSRKWLTAAGVETTVRPSSDKAAVTWEAIVTWRSRVDLPSSVGTMVYFRVTPYDSQRGSPETTGPFEIVNLLGDYDDDRDVDFDDLADFARRWRRDDLAADLGPVTGAAPKLHPTRDGVLDADDSSVFARMWK